MPNNTKATKHGTKRMTKRLGINKKSVDKTAQKAFDNGLTHAETKGSLHKYIDKLCLQHGRGCTYRVYHRNTYCFTKTGSLITVIQLPQNLYKLADKQEKEKAECESNTQQNSTT